MCDCCGGPGASFRILAQGFCRPSALTAQPAFAEEHGDIPVPPPPPALGRLREPAPELVVFARRIHTLDNSQPEVEALAFSDGLLQAVGSRHEVLALCGPKTKFVDLGRRVVYPGFVDPHVHAAFATTQDWLDVGPFTTATVAEAAEKIQRAAQGLSRDTWIKAKMLDLSLMPGEPLDRFQLDRLSPQAPVIVLETNGHVLYANSRALELAGVNRNTPDPPTARYIRDERGELTGRIEEPAAFTPLLIASGFPTPQQMASNVNTFMQGAAERGCTTLHDCGIGALAAESDLELLDAVMATEPPVRYAGMLVSTHMSLWEKRRLRPGARSKNFHLTGIKAWADGSAAARTAFMREPYLGGETRGALNYTPEGIEETLRAAHGAGWQVGIHSNGDAAMDVVLDAFDRVLAKSPRRDHRHRIEHASFLRPEHVTRMARLGVSPSFLIGHVHYWGKAYQERLLGPTCTDLLDPCASALRAGLRISFHSDYAVTPIDPLRAIQTAVVRDMREGGQVLNPDERISPLEAIRAVTLDAAWQCRLDHVCGSLEVGKAADFVVLEEDPLEVEPTKIAGIQIHSTWLEGKQRTGPAPEPCTSL